MKIYCEAPEIMQLNHYSHIADIALTKPENYVLFTYEEYDYLIRLLHMTGLHINYGLYARGIYEQRTGDGRTHIKVPLDYILQHIRVLILADYNAPNKNADFMPTLRGMLKMVGLYDV